MKEGFESTLNRGKGQDTRAIASNEVSIIALCLLATLLYTHTKETKHIQRDGQKKRKKRTLTASP